MFALGKMAHNKGFAPKSISFTFMNSLIEYNREGLIKK